MRKPVFWIVPIIVAAFIVIAGGLLWGLRLLEPALIYHPLSDQAPTPAAVGLPYQAVTLRTADGEDLQAWWLPRPDAQAPLMLFLHGNAGTRAHRLHNLQWLAQAGVAVLILDYRGYGGSTGKPSEAGLIEDGLAGFDWLSKQAPGRPVTVFGRSLGAAVATQVAVRRPVAGLILESPFTSIGEMAKRTLPIPGIDRLVRTRFDNLKALSTLRTPLLVIHGEADRLIPVQMGKTLYGVSASVRKTLHLVPDGDHNDTYVVAGNQYLPWLKAFLASVQTPSSGK